MRFTHLIPALLLAACGEPEASAPDGVVFPTHPGDAGPYPSALLEDARIEVVDGCVYLSKGGERWLGLWPARYHVERTDDGLVLAEPDGTVVANEGIFITVGGGESRPSEVGGSDAGVSWAEELTDERIPPRCGDLFWLVSGIE